MKKNGEVDGLLPTARDNDVIKISALGLPVLPAGKNAQRILQKDLFAKIEDPVVLASLIRIFAGKPRLEALVAALLFHSPYLAAWIRKYPEWLLASCEAHPDVYLQRCLAEIEATALTAKSLDDAMRRLRLLRNQLALHIALMDCGGQWSLQQVTRALTETADACVRSALELALAKSEQSGRLRFTAQDGGDPRTSRAEQSGLTILAMGKHGASELNYSSDIDLIVLFDPDLVPAIPPHDPQNICIRVIQDIVKLLDQKTADGHVFRVDLRLRPDPGSTPVAIPLIAAFSYYESVGQNWERAALIKARPVAGNLQVGSQFLADLSPFIWRKYFDYAAIADIHAMKRQIYIHKGHSEVAVEGHDLKLGRGGIREIEFFVQTQQLIYGGRRQQLRKQRTLEMLEALETDGWIDATAVSELGAAYIFLRSVEHRLQMVNDEQTQRLPRDTLELEKFAQFCGFSPARFRKLLLGHLKNVERHYARLFEHAADLSSNGGSLVFTGTENDPETLKTIKGLGFVEPSSVAEIVRGWHFGRRKAVTTARARENLTELVPKLLKAFGKSTDPDAAITALDDAFSRMPAAVELFAILTQNKALLELFAELLGNAPRLAAIVARRPHVLDSLLDPDFVAATDQIAVDRRISTLLARSVDFEDFLNQARELAYSERFLIGARVLSGLLDPLEAGLAHSVVAEAFLRQALEQVKIGIEAKYGSVENGRLAVLGFGKLGGREMTAASDLDLVIIFDAPSDSVSSGPRQLAASEYYTRLTQSLVTALSSPMTRGVLYDIDLRLRPSGRKGPVAISFAGFIAYQETEAETWERMALTRARPVAGDIGLCDELISKIGNIIRLPRLENQLRQDIFEMRRLVASEKGEDQIFDLKLAKGGLLDIEFIAQFLNLNTAKNKNGLGSPNTGESLRSSVQFGFIEPDRGQKLLEAWLFYSNLEQVLRLCLEDRFEPSKLRHSFQNWLSQMLSLPDFKTLQRYLLDLQREVRMIFDEILSKPH